MHGSEHIDAQVFGDRLGLGIERFAEANGLWMGRFYSEEGLYNRHVAIPLGKALQVVPVLAAIAGWSEAVRVRGLQPDGASYPWLGIAHLPAPPSAEQLADIEALREIGSRLAFGVSLDDPRVVALYW